MRTVIPFMHNNQVETRNSEKFYQSFLIASLSLCRKIIVQLFFNFAHKLTKHHRNSPDLVINCTEMKSSTAESMIQVSSNHSYITINYKMFPQLFLLPLYCIRSPHKRLKSKSKGVNRKQSRTECSLPSYDYGLLCLSQINLL